MMCVNMLGVYVFERVGILIVTEIVCVKFSLKLSD